MRRCFPLAREENTKLFAYSQFTHSSDTCFVWTPGRVAAAFATANGDPNKIPNTKLTMINPCQQCKDVIKAKGFEESQIYFDLFNTFLLLHDSVCVIS